ncbi:MAG: hypothetical protein SFW65_02040 [Alphaproteobacteria bacterium]|nr:hypothetical protein [Alphaproteobacteria bacterium]
MMKALVMTKSPSAREGYVAESLAGAKACIIPTTADTPEMLVSVEGFDASKFEAAYTYAKGLHGYDGWNPSTQGAYRHQTICAFEILPDSKKATLGHFRTSINLTSIKMDSSMFKMADIVYHERMHAIWEILNRIKYGSTEGDFMLREIGLDEANAFARSFLALQIRKLTTTDMNEARNIQKHLSSFQPTATQTFDQMVKLYGVDTLKESIAKTGMLPPEFNRIIFMQLLEELIDRDYGHHLHEQATPSTNARITINDSEIGMILNFDMPFYGASTSWGGFTTHVATHLPIVEKLKHAHPDDGSHPDQTHSDKRPLSIIASFANSLNLMIKYATKDWDFSATIAADLTGTLYNEEAVKAAFIREDLRTLTDIAIKRVEVSTSLSPAVKEKLSKSLMILGLNLQEPPTPKGHEVPHYGTEAALSTKQFFQFIERKTPCIQFAPLIARDYAANMRENPVSGNYRFHTYLEQLAADARKKLGSIQGYSPQLKGDLASLIDDLVLSVKLARPLTGETTLRGLTSAQRKAQCG